MAATAMFHNAVERYADWQPIGQGGSAKVFRAFDRDLGIPLAIKILNPELYADPGRVDALRSEVLISRALRHPNICPIHDLYEGPYGIGVIMDLLEGQDLRHWIAAQRGRLLDTLPERVTVFRRIADALVVAHSRIIHRDLKPANVFLRGGDIGQPLIMDFGLSILGPAADRLFAGGTPKYMAPEQYLAPETVDQRSELFALGVTAYELLTDGRIPESSLKDLTKTRKVPHVAASAITPPSRFCAAIPPALDGLIAQMVATDPATRPTSAEEVGQALAVIEVGRSVVPEFGAAPRGFDAVAISGGAYLIGPKPRKRALLGPFRLAPHPVSNTEYRRFLAATGWRTPPLLDDPMFGRADVPVVGVSWDDAVAYATWAGGRLPSEIEWEVAAKAGAAEAEYPWGGAPPSPTQANIDRIHPHTTPLARYPTGRNPCGLWDMCGNVCEWCADPFDEALYRRIAADERNPRGQGESELRPLRGGSFDSFAPTGRCGFRANAERSELRADIGFRIAFDADR